MIGNQSKINPEEQTDFLVQNNQVGIIASHMNIQAQLDCEDDPKNNKLRWIVEGVILVVILALIAIKYKAPSCIKQWPLYGDYLAPYKYGDPVDFTKINKKNYNPNADLLSPIGIEYAVNLLNILGKNIQNDRFLSSIQQKQKQLYQSKYHTNKYQEEIQFCVIVQSYESQTNNRYKANLDSIFQQNYQNYFVVYVNDFSLDNTKQIIQQYVQNNSIAKQKMIVINNDVRKGKVRNQYQMGHKFCKPGSIMLTIDGDDNLIGRQAFKLLNAVYQQKNTKFVSAGSLNFVNNPKSPQIYQSAQEKPKLYCWMSDIFLSLSQKDYKSNKNNNQWISNQVVNTFLKDLAGDKIETIPQIIYLNHEYQSDKKIQQNSLLTKNIIKKQPYSKKIQFRLKHSKTYKQDSL